MSHLKDMEELISTIDNSDNRDYMHEAMLCYMSSAYRASIVLSFIALFGDLMVKLKELSKVNKGAKKIYEEASKKQSDQEVFENYLIDQLRSNNYITELDTNFLDILRTLRNKSAHPSGHASSAEEARYVIYETITRFLSKPVLSTTQLVEEILSDLPNSNLFPSSKVESITNITSSMITNLHQETYTYLVVKLIEKYLDPDKNIQKNAKNILAGIASLNNQELNEIIKQKILIKKCTDPNYSELILILISVNSVLISNLDQITIDRITVFLDKSIANTEPYASYNLVNHPSMIFSSIIKTHGEDLTLTLFGKQLTTLINRFTYIPQLITLLSSNPKIQQQYLSILLEQAKSQEFDVANYFATSIADIESNLLTIITPEYALKLILGVIRAAHNGAYRSKDLVRSRFSSLQGIKDLACSFFTSNQALALSMAKENYVSQEEVGSMFIDPATELQTVSGA